MKRTAQMDAEACAGRVERQLDGAKAITKRFDKRGAWKVVATYDGHTIGHVFDGATSEAAQFDLAKHQAERIIRALKLAHATGGKR